MSFIHPTIAGLDDLACSLRDEYSSANPFPHIIIDNLFDPAKLRAVLDEFPDLQAIDGATSYQKQTEVKLASGRGDKQQGQLTKQFLRYLNSTSFIDFLQSLTSISEPLIPDPHFVGGGLHEIRPGGFLKIHADFCKHGDTQLDRRLNLLIYLNRDWHESYGGHLEFWNESMSHCAHRILPIFNRTVVFSTTNTAFHGHPEALTCPAHRTRKSLALYYYTNGRPASEIRPSYHNQSTLFKRRPGESFSQNDLNGQFKRTIKALTPPIVLEIAKRLFY